MKKNEVEEVEIEEECEEILNFSKDEGKRRGF